MSKDPAKQPPAKPDDEERDELAEFLMLARRLVAVPKEEIDAAKANGTQPQAE